MKGKLTYQKIFLLGLCAYLLALMCLTGVSVYTVYSRYNNLVQVAQKDLDHYLRTGTFDMHLVQYESNNFVYASNGQRVDFSTSDQAELYFNVDAYAMKLSAQLDDSPIYRILFSPNLRYHFAVAVAIPIEDGGMFLFLKELPDVNRIFFSLCLAITLLCFLCVVWLLLALHGNKRLENLRREYVDNVSHELKSPIAAVKALAEPLQDGMVRDEETLQRYIGIILSETNTLEHTVRDMLELSRLQHRSSRTKKAPVSAREVFQDTITKYTALCNEFGLSFSLVPALDAWPALYTHKDLAAQLLEVLLDNAVKFSSSSGDVRVNMEKRGNRLAISVSNDGSAIAPADQKRVFERFYQGGKGHNQRGSGLGLAIAQEIADNLNEKLWLERSIPGETVFAFTLKTSGTKSTAAGRKICFHRLHK